MDSKSNESSHAPIKSLLLGWRPGQVVTSTLLARLGVTKQLASYLKQTGVLSPLGKGAFRKSTEMPPWSAGVEALEQQLGIAVHVGGRTALDLQGVTQYAVLGSHSPVWLFGRGRLDLPKWFLSHGWGVDIHLVNAQLFAHPGAETNEVQAPFSVRASRRERAVMEAIHLIGKYHRFEEVAELFEGLTSLDPEVVQRLLEDCRSYKVRRVFLFLARQSGHAWFSKLDPSKVDLGKGKREVIKGGRYDVEYRITVPRAQEESDV